MQWPPMFDGNRVAKSSLFGWHVKATQAMWVPNRDQECGKGNWKNNPLPSLRRLEEGELDSFSNNGINKEEFKSYVSFS